jgi:hypothetical protein
MQVKITSVLVALQRLLLGCSNELQQVLQELVSIFSWWLTTRDNFGTPFFHNSDLICDFEYFVRSQNFPKMFWNALSLGASLQRNFLSVVEKQRSK